MIDFCALLTFQIRPNYYASQGENKLAKEVKNIMKQNKEILIEGEIPKEYLKRVNQNKKGKC